MKEEEKYFKCCGLARFNLVWILSKKNSPLIPTPPRKPRYPIFCSKFFAIYDFTNNKIFFPFSQTLWAPWSSFVI